MHKFQVYSLMNFDICTDPWNYHLSPDINHHWGNSLTVQWLGLQALTAEGPGLIPGRGTKIPRAMCGQKKKVTEVCLSLERCAQESLLWPFPHLRVSYFSQILGLGKGWAFVSHLSYFLLPIFSYAFMGDKGLPFSTKKIPRSGVIEVHLLSDSRGDKGFWNPKFAGQNEGSTKGLRSAEGFLGFFG